ncbi:ABC transporter substrate-binding protein [Corynebacterium cystitidis]|uniref:ABC transporter substrate-binding protein n=1 Tax=Corynebacterium cystitidis TaxID=35757 RepID=UPI00211E6CFF|nr:ABC transporter substrate-binding protein [Corynebacterium cystitidis]
MTNLFTRHLKLRQLLALGTGIALSTALIACSDDAADQANSDTATATGTAQQGDPAVATNTAAESSGEVITDSYGNEFELPVSFDEAIVLNTSAYEMIQVLGQDDKVVGVGDSVTGGEADSLDKYGDWREPNVEAILEAQPDVVFGYSSWLDEGIAEQLEEGGVRVAMVDLSQPSEMIDEIEFMGKLLGAEEQAEEFTSDITAIVDDVAQRTKDVTPARGYWEGYSDYSSVGPGSGGHELLELANVKNLMADEGTEYPKASDEFVLEADPEIIVKMVSGSEKALGPDAPDPSAAKALHAELVGRPGWEGIDAVKEGRVVLLPQEIGTNPLGMAMVPLIVGKVAYPDEFADIEPEEKLDELLRKYWDTTAEGAWVYIG